MVEVIAEFTTNHCGNLALLLRMVDAAADAGALWIKMQKKDVNSYYTKDKLNAPFQSPYGKTYGDYRTLFELSHDDWLRFDERCRLRKTPWFVTVQDVPSLEWFVKNMPRRRYKIASSNARNKAFLRRVAAAVPTDCELVISVAGSTLWQVNETLRMFDQHRKIWLLHCVAEYPCPPERLRLGNITEMRKRFACDRVHIGYSGHEQGYGPTLAAVGLGAEMIERHFCLSRHSFVHHIECSLEPDEFAAMVQSVQSVDWNGRNLPDELKQTLPPEAYWIEFGMSEAEKRFLIEQSYGNAFLGEASGFRKG